MAIHSGFFNALEVGGEYDRVYDASDYSDNMGAIISSGVRRSGDDDLVVTSNGLVITVGVGRAWVLGHWLKNDTAYNVATVTAPTGITRYDGVYVHLDENVGVRSVSIIYKQGTFAGSPAPVREGGIYELQLAEITVADGATNVTVTDTRPDKDLCGWITTPIGYDDYFVSLESAFETWFNAVKGQLSTDVAGNLQVQISQQNVAISRYAPVTIFDYYGEATDAQQEKNANPPMSLTSNAWDFERLVIEYTVKNPLGTVGTTLNQASVYVPEYTTGATIPINLQAMGTISSVSPSGEVTEPTLSTADYLISSLGTKCTCTDRTDASGLGAIRIIKILGYGNKNASPIAPYNETQTDSISDSIEEGE